MYLYLFIATCSLLTLSFFWPGLNHILIPDMQGWLEIQVSGIISLHYGRWFLPARQKKDKNACWIDD